MLSTAILCFLRGMNDILVPEFNFFLKSEFGGVGLRRCAVYLSGMWQRGQSGLGS